MIHLAGSVKRSFIFPCDIHNALDFYMDMSRIFRYIPYITLIETYSKTEFRVQYRSVELNIYQIELYCDIQVKIDHSKGILEVCTLPGKEPIKKRAGMHSLRGMANYQSISTFKDEGEETRIYYHLDLEGSLPKPFALSLVPNTITDHIAENIASRRIFEIADGFIVGSLKDFQENFGCPDQEQL